MTRFGADDLSEGRRAIYSSRCLKRRQGSEGQGDFGVDRSCWIEVIAMERRRGPDASYWLEDRINELLHDGETLEASHLLKIAELLAILQERTTLQ